MTAPVERLLQRLEKVRSTGRGSWLACCPSHEDRTPSLSLKEGDDDRVLLRCWAGCTAHEVVGALGMTLADLFPPRPAAAGGGHKPQRRPWTAGDLIDLAAHEAGVVVVIVSDMLRNSPDTDVNRLLEAAGRLANMKEAVHGRP